MQAVNFPIPTLSDPAMISGKKCSKILDRITILQSDAAASRHYASADREARPMAIRQSADRIVHQACRFCSSTCNGSPLFNPNLCPAD